VSYTVIWNRRSLEALAALWVDRASERAAISDATALIDGLLQANPQEQGESREGNERIVFAPPLVVAFAIDDSRQLVRITRVRHLRQHGPDRGGSR
jgi:plasmid stabilization system protein ParE